MTAARLLHHAGIGFELLEARNRLGGRILSADATGEPSANGFDLGPSWFWPAMQPELATLVAELGLSVFVQNSEGDIVFQRTVHEKPQRYPGMRQEPPSMRIAGGTGALVTALASRLPAGCLHLGSRVTDVRLADEIVELRIVGPAGAERSLRGSHVIFALPPRLLEATIAFTPALDAQTREVLQNEFLDIWMRGKKSIIFVTHDLNEAVTLADRIIGFPKGRSCSSSKCC